MSVLPWDPDFVPPAIDPNLVSEVTQAVTGAATEATQAVTQAATQVATQVAQTAGTAVSDATTAVENTVASTIPAVITATTGTPTTAGSATPTSISVVLPGSSSTGAAGSLVANLEQAALQAAQSTTSALLPSIEKALQDRVASSVQSEASKILTSIQGGESVPAVPSLADFTKADARSRALRTLLIGLALSVLWGLVNVAGQILNVDWANNDAWPQVASIATTAVVGSVVAYIGRMLNTPTHIQNATIIPGGNS